ncbi:hypothetical protein TPR58_19120 [Sphingomonas sp. HF-S3]|uniref:Uncharacterized protein n=1 Tax=Sphingomonas rustica TaxID=3103142 RepID=A0ABV0BE26_9SPHN
MTSPISLAPSTTPPVRNATRLLTMVHELHKAGYQRIRISPGMSPSGVYWRCSITHIGAMDADGRRVAPGAAADQVAFYTSGAEDRYFDWPDARARSGRELAVRFIERFPQIAQPGLGRDWAYAGWLTEILGRAELGRLPVFFADYPLSFEDGDLPPAPATAPSA